MSYIENSIDWLELGITVEHEHCLSSELEQIPQSNRLGTGFTNLVLSKAEG